MNFCYEDNFVLDKFQALIQLKDPSNAAQAKIVN